MRLETERLVLRDWRDADRQTFAAFHADPVARKYFYPERVTAAAVDTMVDGMVADLARYGFGFLAVERKSDGAFMGETGLAKIDQPTLDAMARPSPVEIGWFFGRSFWGQGYATEAAGAWVDYAFGILDLPELVAFSQAENLASHRVMQKLGMVQDLQPGFEDPRVPEGHWQRPHVIYRLANPHAS